MVPRRPEYVPGRIDDPNYVRIFDTTLRDGEQSPRPTMTSTQKLVVARQLACLGVDIIEAGFPASSPDDLDAMRSIAIEVGNTPVGEGGHMPVICGLSRCNRRDIDAAWEAMRHARKPRIHTFIATSEIHMQHKLRKTPEQVVAIAKEMVAYARSLGCPDVEFSPEDARRSNREFLYHILEEVIKAGAATLNIADTVGYALPHEFGKLIADIKENTPGIGNAIISTHCHNDLGLASANTLAVQEHSGLHVQPHKAIVGANAFAHESGIHQRFVADSILGGFDLNQQLHEDNCDVDAAVNGNAAFVPGPGSSSFMPGPESAAFVPGPESAASGNAAEEAADVISSQPAVPYVGMVFDDLEEAYKIYNDYAYKIGFGIRIGNTKYNTARNVPKDTILTRVFECVHTGKIAAATKGARNRKDDAANVLDSTVDMSSFTSEKQEKDKGMQMDLSDTRQRNRLLRYDCKAHMHVGKRNGSWTVTVFTEEHTHPMVKQLGRHRYYRSHRKVPEEDFQLLQTLHNQNITTAQIMGCLGNVRGGDLRTLGYVKRDVSNIRAMLRNDVSLRDMSLTIEYFEKRKAESPSFFYATQLDENNAQYELCQNLMLDREDNAGFTMETTGRPLWGSWNIEAQSQKFYTPEVFERFQKMISTSTRFHPIHVEAEILSFDLVPNIGLDIKTYRVEVVAAESLYSCGCNSFEMCGLLCPHIIRVMVHLNVQEIPSRYLLHRWSAAATTTPPDPGTNTIRFGVPTTNTLKYNALCRKMNNLASDACYAEDTYAIVSSMVDEACKVVTNMRRARNGLQQQADQLQEEI
ncbi:hypothetical protein ACQ4PT_046983 [Festuca glaucescens]